MGKGEVGRLLSEMAVYNVYAEKKGEVVCSLCVIINPV